jgi:uncharacterized protein YbaP (TraB family)
LGSIHIGTEDIYPLDSSIEDAFGETDFLVVEADPSLVNEGELVSMLQQYGLYPHYNGLSKNMPKDLYDELDAKMREFGEPLGDLEIFRPWVVQMIYEQYVEESLGYSGENGIDEHFLNEAQDNEKKVLQLESIDFQFKLLSSISDDIIVKLIADDLDDPETEADLEAIFTIWENGDRAAMTEWVLGDREDHPEYESYYKAMLDERNYGMLEKIEEFLADSHTYFVVVGAAHLVGEDGLLQLLEDDGYQEEQLVYLDR